MNGTAWCWRCWLHLLCAALSAICLVAATSALSSEALSPAKSAVVGGFSAQSPGDIPAPPWRVQTFKKIPRHTAYSLVADDGTTVLRARADNAAASLIRPVPTDLAVATSAAPVLRWRWKPLLAPDRSALGLKDADDWGARLYVLFEPPPASLGLGERMGLALARALYGDDLPARGLCYVWTPGGNIGAMAPNAFTDRLVMIIVDAGLRGSWRPFERNLADDYRAAFGQAMPPPTAIAVSADSDNSGGIAEVLIGDIVLDVTPAGTGTPPGS